MNKFKCLIVDDEPIAQRIIEGYLANFQEFVVVDKCLHALAARTILQKETIDLMFLDLEMPKLKGLAFLKTLQTPPAVIITTAHREYALEGFELEVLDYLLKPISFERFLKAINRFQKLHTTTNLPIVTSTLNTTAFLYVKSNRKTLKINQQDIDYIEGMNNYIKIYHQQKVYIVYTSLQKILADLNTQFLRIHKSYIVNKHKIKAFNQEQIDIGNKQLPIGNTYRDVIEQF